MGSGINLRAQEFLKPMQIMKLAANFRIRETGRKVMVEMEKAGVDLSKMVCEFIDNASCCNVDTLITGGYHVGPATIRTR